jgi:hypothetical protein
VRSFFTLVALSLAVGGCSSAHSARPNAGSLAILRQLTSDQQSFGVVLDAETGRALAAFRVNNPIRAAVPDGDGGWYVGGGFIHVNGVLRKRLAHIDANGRLDRAWKPEANGNGVSVTSLARIGSRLYVGGDFATLQHQARFQLGALDLPSGKLDRWRPVRSSWYSYDGLLGVDRRLIAGGTSCCSEAGSSVVALDTRTGTFDKTWRPHVGPAKLWGDGVYMLTENGSGVLIRGLFGRPHGRIAVGEMDGKNGRLVRKWLPHASVPCLWCTLMAAAVGRERVFASVNGGTSLYKVVAFSRQTGEIDRGWRARISTVTGFYGASSATALAVAGHRVYLTGDFDHVNGVARNGFAALDPRTAHLLPSWHPNAPFVSGGWLLAPSGDRLLVGISLARRLQFSYVGLKTYRPVRTLRLTLALNGPGRVRIGLGRGCDVKAWETSSSLRCAGKLLRWLTNVRFERPGRKAYVHGLRVRPGRYFVHFVPTSPNGVPQPGVQDFPIVVP